MNTDTSTQQEADRTSAAGIVDPSSTAELAAAADANTLLVVTGELIDSTNHHARWVCGVAHSDEHAEEWARLANNLARVIRQAPRIYQFDYTRMLLALDRRHPEADTALYKPGESIFDWWEWSNKSMTTTRYQVQRIAKPDTYITTLSQPVVEHPEHGAMTSADVDEQVPENGILITISHVRDDEAEDATETDQTLTEVLSATTLGEIAAAIARAFAKVAAMPLRQTSATG